MDPLSSPASPASPASSPPSSPSTSPASPSPASPPPLPEALPAPVDSHLGKYELNMYRYVPHQPYYWLYLSNNNVWTFMNTTMAAEVETQYQRDYNNAYVNGFYFNFNLMTQYGQISNITRRVLRLCPYDIQFFINTYKQQIAERNIVWGWENAAGECVLYSLQLMNELDKLVQEAEAPQKASSDADTVSVADAAPLANASYRVITRVSMNGLLYEFNLNTMQQRNINSWRSRKIIQKKYDENCIIPYLINHKSN